MRSRAHQRSIRESRLSWQPPIVRGTFAAGRHRSCRRNQKSTGDDLSILRVMENGLKVTLPAPAPLDCEPPVAFSSSTSLSSLIAGVVTRSMFMCFLQVADLLDLVPHWQCRHDAV